MPAEECRSAICNLAMKSPSGYENSGSSLVHCRQRPSGLESAAAVAIGNNGQVRLNSGLVGVDKTERIAVDRLVNPLGAPAVENARAANSPRVRKQLHRVLNGKLLTLPAVLEPI